MYNVLFIFMIFFTYSVLGFIVELICCSISSKKIVYDRGFLLGPYLPIYGTGSLIITYLLSKYHGDILALFIMSMFFCTLLEYITSYIMEKIFKLRWWDYSHEKFNINGRVCLKNGFLFGLAGLLIMEVMNPIVFNLLSMIPKLPFYIISTICLTLFLIDGIITCRLMVGVKTSIGKLEKIDATEQIKKEVNKFLSKYTFLLTRLVKSFPNMEKYNKKSYTYFKVTLKDIKLDLKKLKAEYKVNKKTLKQKKKEGKNK